MDVILFLLSKIANSAIKFMEMFHILLLIHVLYQVTCDIQRYGDGFRADFSIMTKERMPNVLMNVEDCDLRDCYVKCIMHVNCVSVNYKTLRRVCELTDRNFVSNMADLNTPSWTNHETPPFKGI